MATLDVSKSPPTAPELTALVVARARSLGFDAANVARADVAVETDFARYRDFTAKGMHGEMDWLAENAEARRRVDTDAILPGAKSIVCLARRYQRSDADEAKDPETARSIARYARGQDYHNFIRRRLRKLAAFVRTLGTEDAPVEARPLCDDAPIFERAWAARAGLGFVGKNGLLIVPGEGGSFVLLGEVVTTLELVPGEPIAERCGSCTRCLDACPTQAFVEPFVLDPRRCISYWTIEASALPPEPLRERFGDHVFGCDDCQTVCPFNASTRGRDGGRGADPFAPLARWGEVELSGLLDMDEARWKELSAASPVRRATRDGLARNAALVLGNRGERSSLPVLRRVADADPSTVVRQASRWAVERIERGGRNCGVPREKC
jgi:epoxyqueuosine reductase